MIEKIYLPLTLIRIDKVNLNYYITPVSTLLLISPATMSLRI